MQKLVSTFDISGAGPHYLYPAALLDSVNVWPSAGTICSLSISDGTATASQALAIYDMSQITDGAMLGGAAGALAKGTSFLTPGGSLVQETQNPADVRGTADPGIASFRKVWEGNLVASRDERDLIATCPAGIIIVTPQLAAGHLRVTWSPLVLGGYRKRAAETTGEHMPAL